VVNELEVEIGEPPVADVNQLTGSAAFAVKVTDAGPHALAPVTVGGVELFIIAVTATGALGQTSPAKA
jgi:hypothetical protein